MKKLITFIIIISIAFLAVFIFWKTTDKKEEQNITIENYNVSHDTKFGGIYINISIDDFNKIGFKYGDSVDIKFSNGYELKDIPYYNGYYVEIGELEMVGYPGYPYIKVCRNYGDDLWTEGNINENITATVSLNKAKKYLDIQEASDIKYTDTQGDIPDIVFANFRSVNVGKMKENILYRSASPIDNSHNRAAVTDKLMKEAKVNYEVDLSDSDEELIEHMAKSDFNSPYFKTLYDKKNVIALNMNMQIKDNPKLQGTSLIKNEISSNLMVKLQMKELTFGEKLVQGLKAMSEHDGPYLIHCVEGKDRTGYVVMVLSALSGATYQEMVDDYMITYDNYYGINLNTDKSKYDTIKNRNIDMFLRYISDNDGNLNVDLTNINYEEAITKYLLKIGMKQEDINKLKTKLTK